MSLPPTADCLPAALVDRDQWVCWRTQDRDGKATKVPIVPGTAQFASTTDPETWGSFTAARDGVTTTSVDGLGFVFTADDPLIGIDLDDCRDPESGEPTAWAEAIIADLDSYTEISPSGTGYHILVTGTLPDGRNRAGDLELYDRSRFFTVTGDHVAETPPSVHERTDAVATLHAGEIAAASTPTADAAAAPSSAAADGAAADADADTDADAAGTRSEAAALSDTDLLSRARSAANGAKFSRLWTGDASDYESHSEADLALCCLLAFWTGRDAQRMDRLFRESGLYREKWDTVHYADGSTYGEKTIDRAIATTDDVYTPPDTTDTAATSGATAADSGAATPPDHAGRSDGQSAAAPDADTPASADAAASSVDGESGAAVSADDAVATAAAGAAAARSRPQRAAARLARLEELTTRVEALLAENERLRAELDAERARRKELEAALDETDATGASRGWWPFSRG